MSYPLVLMACIALAIGAAGAEPAEGRPAENRPVEMRRGEVAYVVAAPRSALEKRALQRLRAYLEAVLGAAPRTVRSLARVPRGRPAIVLSTGGGSPLPLRLPDRTEEDFALATGSVDGRPVVVAAGRTDRGLKRAVQRLIIASRQESHALVLPALDLAESPWIPHREWTACPWKPQLVRGYFHNPDADRRLDIYGYDAERLGRYVEMFDWFGFSGCQLMETCYTYAAFGSVEAAQEWQKRVAGMLRDNGQEVSLWAWAAQFTGHGWIEPEAVFVVPADKPAFDDPAVRRAFERQYDRYAELAPYVDRFIGHFFDPGVLTRHSDVFQAMRLLEGKLRAKNPKLQMGIDCWAASPDYLVELAKNGLKDCLMLPVSFPELYGPGQRERFHEQAKQLGLKLGIWGWYTTEYESDQIASMYVNARLLKDFYQRMKQGALQVHPVEYWSEMEAHHLNNIYSMYAAGQLLWNPERDAHQILAELTGALWGPRNGPAVLEALELIEDVRSGPTWETYWWTRPTHRIGTEDPAEDLRRAEASLAALRGMKEDAGFVPKIPLPYPPRVFVELMLPHLEQVRLFAQFRLKVAELRSAAGKGAPKETLEKLLREAWQPVPELGTWIGTFGCQELREQKRIVVELRAKYALDVPDPEPLRYLEADRVLQMLRYAQRSMKEPFAFEAMGATGEFYWPDPMRLDRFRKLVDAGVVKETAPGQYQLTDWQSWAAR